MTREEVNNIKQERNLKALNSSLKNLSNYNNEYIHLLREGDDKLNMYRCLGCTVFKVVDTEYSICIPNDNAFNEHQKSLSTDNDGNICGTMCTVDEFVDIVNKQYDESPYKMIDILVTLCIMFRNKSYSEMSMLQNECNVDWNKLKIKIA